MQRRYLIVLLLTISSCDQPTHTTKGDGKRPDTKSVPNIAYSLINARTDNGAQLYDIYIKDIRQIKTLNLLLREKYNRDGIAWIQINYFNDSAVAKTYFEKQFDSNVSDKEKDKLFRYYIANYKFNPATKYDSLIFEH